ncbi:hypothetical protein [Streptomyces mirabilis]|uniref:hypothetical protein n=1 Tax=Streptomyces mirabilis TaxID=68239 RepID=UPI0033207D25
MADGVPEDHRRSLGCLRAAADRARQGGGRDTVAVLADALLGGYQRTGSFEELSEAITLLKEERVDLGSQWGQYEYVTNVGFAA